MKKFKTIPIEGLEHLEINEDGYILDPITGGIEYMEQDEFLCPTDSNDDNVSRDLVIEVTFGR